VHRARQRRVRRATTTRRLTRRAWPAYDAHRAPLLGCAPTLGGQLLLLQQPDEPLDRAADRERVAACLRGSDGSRAALDRAAPAAISATAAAVAPALPAPVAAAAAAAAAARV
jgi:hypothetical protein